MVAAFVLESLLKSIERQGIGFIERSTVFFSYYLDGFI